MANYITSFQTLADYEAAKENLNYPNVTLIDTDGSLIYEKEAPHYYSKDYFTMIITASGIIKFSGSTKTNMLSYSKDNGTTWSTPIDRVTTISVNAGDKVLWKGTPTPSGNGIGRFSGATNVRYSVEGNAMSLLYGDNFKGQTDLTGKDLAFVSLFSGNINVTSAENLVLPATTLADYCYSGMFQGCSSLTTAPELPATTLAISCYANMFQDCMSLTKAPELPAVYLAIGCYNNMFYGCTSLNHIKCLATDISANYCTRNWVSGVAASGTFVKDASMTGWTTGGNGIPSGWTVQDA